MNVHAAILLLNALASGRVALQEVVELEEGVAPCESLLSAGLLRPTPSSHHFVLTPRGEVVARELLALGSFA